MSDSKENPKALSDYVPNHGASGAYDAVNQFNAEGLEGLCPSYYELNQQEKDRYDEGIFLGKGALKEVYKVFDKRTQRSVAMARLRTDRGPSFFDHFVNESWIMTSLKHPNIIKVFDVGVDASSKPYYTMDLKSNQTLQDFAQTDKTRDLSALIEIFEKVCDAVAYAHSQGIIHLDLKPENIQCDAYGEVLVCDWGLAKSLISDDIEESEESDPRELVLDNATLLGEAKGTPGFMAPEQLDGNSIKDVKTDIYALGCMLHFILTGSAPYTGTKEQIIEATKASKIVPIRTSFPNLHIPISLEAIVMQATQLEPDQRYDSVKDLKHDLQSYLDGYSTQAEESGFFREAKLFFRRNRTPSTIAITAFLIVGIASAFFIEKITEHKIATEQERARADQLDLSLSEVHTEFDTWLEQSEASRQDLASSLADASRRIKNIGIFDRPVMSVEEAKQLAQTALKLNENEQLGYSQAFALNCLELNYKTALSTVEQMPEAFNERYDNYLSLAKAFPDFSFNRFKRPSIQELVDFLQKAHAVNPNCGRHLHRVITYDFAARGKDPTGYHEVLEAYLQYMHDGGQHFTLHYDPTASVLTLWTDQSLHLFDGKYSFLRFLLVKALKLETEQPFDLNQLAETTIETLDLSSSDAVNTGSIAVRIPYLERIIVRPGQFTTNTLNRWIISNNDFQIIESDRMNREF
ncbi:MAG: serine/threonine protein kinase [Opitutaceae bacterium]